MRPKAKNKKFKILLLQLHGIDLLLTRNTPLNMPFAAGYLKAMLYKEGLLDEVDVEILDLNKTPLPGNARLVDLIVSRSPDLLGLTLFSFNSIQSLYIAENVKRRLPGLKVIVGGPEVTAETSYILNNPVVDIGCIGQGEVTFVQIVKDIMKNKSGYADIKGIFYKRSDRVNITPSREPIRELDSVPSPYIEGFINLNDYITAFIETYRGCYFKCTYCSYNKPYGYFSANRVQEEIEFLKQNGIKKIYFIDSNFILSPVFYDACERIIRLNTHNDLEFYADISVEHLDDKKADLLKACNFKGVEAGLQTINPATLKNIGRPLLNAEKFKKGIRLLTERKISCAVSVMIGLPQDTLKDIRKTAGFLRESKVGSALAQLLQVFPGTRIRREAKKYGIKYQRKPPYLMIESPYISKGEIKKAVGLYRNASVKQCNVGIFFSYSFCNFPLSLENKGRKKTSGETGLLDSGINKVIIELNEHLPLVKLGEKISRLAQQPFTIWFKASYLQKYLTPIKSFLSHIKKDNPFLVWNVVLETDGVVSFDIIEEIKKSVKAKENLSSDGCFLLEPLSVYIVCEKNREKGSSSLFKKLAPDAKFYCPLNISAADCWENKLDDILKEKGYAGVLMDFDKTLELSFIIRTLKTAIKRTRAQNKTMLFRNIAVYCLFSLIDQGQKNDNTSLIKPAPSRIIYINKDFNISSECLPDADAFLDLVEFQVKSLRALRKI
ncbi:MAG: hypothetical protein COV72_00025 [Candidatus Omnitrophica bacterium CG11_big_fil_rev_8_21_14_0_20_42_13]|uniref:Uncharacterized protein n=1 Tax=Candidatus Ghiorseimicrobium undicola TaxID=1974746 RepID=A0A2H0M082_9BACT|nr:MAG: hypothetical protein COV72_00025 [Candidatus Omnitrophica bacterium CG11_big_fil_rev_8_21_14_0_20_42_13]